MHSEILVNSYTEKGYEPVPLVRLSTEEYTRGLQCFVPCCTDIILLDSKRKLIYLVRRNTKPMKGWWWLGGKMNPDDTKESAVVRSLEREAGLRLTIERFRFVAFLDYRWKDREQHPQNIGCHMAAYTFIVELTPEEIIYASNHLDETSDKEAGLVSFDREQIVEEIAKGKTASVILDLYDFIF